MITGDCAFYLNLVPWLSVLAAAVEMATEMETETDDAGAPVVDVTTWELPKELGVLCLCLLVLQTLVHACHRILMRFIQHIYLSLDLWGRIPSSELPD